ncbi:PAS domain-containing hybrid sensor histidine kinase/response regulator [uncultured Thiodictyon sp.]|uniref:PAS domain-containing hybrid sensor histidine kinase/response regulator n=1 Tax=uncultured Thiodictyon sp. TaxID=1846217 RepID=UPI0025F13D05|nr:PAS domain-containing hybrid sensor histidine kinase/response regulator [uncultured Thiodictyon sp.]
MTVNTTDLEHELRSLSNYSRRLIEASLDPLVTISVDGRIMDVNAATEKVTGRPREQLIGSDFSDYFTEPEQAAAGYRQVFSEGYVTDYPLAIRHADGHVTDVLYNASVYRDDAGEIAGVFAAARDITLRKRAENELRALSNYSRRLIEASLDPLVTISPDGRIMDVNAATETVTGRPREQLIGSDVSDYFTEPERAAAGYRQVFSEGYVTDYPLAIRHADGHVTDVLYNASVYRDDAGEIAGVFAAARDITLRKQAEQAVRELNASLEQKVAERTAQLAAASQAKSEFLANMSHEIRTPLNAILGFAQVLGRDPGLNATQRDSLTTIQRSGEHLLTLINDILDMAKIEAGRMTVRVAPFNLIALVTEVQAFFRQRARERGLALGEELSALPRMVSGDEVKLRQVLINLIGNAVKFTASGSVMIRVAPAGDDAIAFSVIDTGMGIAPHEMARLFEPFSQTASGRQVRGGTGLGLALSSRFVQLMGGELIAESRLGQGSCFSFTLSLPATDAVAPKAEATELPVVGLVPGQPVCRILIVDDLADNRAPLRSLLEGLNPQPPVLALREAADGREAVALWEDWQPHVVFMDMRMPVMSGEEATREIRARMAVRPGAVGTIIVALTASAFNEHRDRFLSCGCDDFAGKPWRAEELFAILEHRAGLRFIRAGDTPAAAVAVSAEEMASRLIALPAEWRASLSEAVMLGDFGRIGALAAQLGDADAVLHTALAAWAYNFDLDAFVALIGLADGWDQPMR